MFGLGSFFSLSGSIYSTELSICIPNFECHPHPEEAPRELLLFFFSPGYGISYSYFAKITESQNSLYDQKNLQRARALQHSESSPKHRAHTWKGSASSACYIKYLHYFKPLSNLVAEITKDRYKCLVTKFACCQNGQSAIISHSQNEAFLHFKSLRLITECLSTSFVHASCKSV